MIKLLYASAYFVAFEFLFWSGGHGFLLVLENTTINSKTPWSWCIEVINLCVVMSQDVIFLILSIISFTFFLKITIEYFALKAREALRQ